MAAHSGKYYRVGEFAEMIGVCSATVRAWDREGTLRPHHRTPGGQRVYAAEQVDEYLSGQGCPRPVAGTDEPKGG